MRIYEHLCGFTLVLAFGFWGSARCAAPPARADFEELLLEKMGVATDTPSLLRYLREQTPNAKDLSQTRYLVKQFSDDSFQIRNDASTRLEKLGSMAIDELVRAMQHPDPEVRSRVQKCIREIEKKTTKDKAGMIVRILASRRDDAATETLLSYLVGVSDEAEKSRIYSALLTLSDSGLNRSMKDAAGHPHWQVRAAAVFVIGIRGTPGIFPIVIRAMKDPEPEVRLRAAQGCLVRNQKCGIDELINLLGCSQTPISWQAEELLIWGLAPWEPPIMRRGTAIVAERKEIQRNWKKWWDANQAKINFDRSCRQGWSPRLLLITGKTKKNGSDNSTRIWLRGSDGRNRAEWDRMHRVAEAGINKEGNLLVIESSGTDSEWDSKGEKNRTRVLDFPIQSAIRRLCDGSVRVATAVGGHLEVKDLGSRGSVVRTWKIRLPNPQARELAVLEDGRVGLVSNADKTSRGVYLAQVLDGTIAFYSSERKLAAKDSPGVAGGGFLVSDQDWVIASNSHGVTKRKRVLLEGFQPIAKLLNGNLLTVRSTQDPFAVVEEWDRSVSVVWEQPHTEEINAVREAYPLLSLGMAKLSVDPHFGTLQYRVKQLGDHDVMWRVLGADHLGRMKNHATEAGRILIQAWDDPATEVRDAISIAIARLGPILIPLLKDALLDRRPAIRLHAVNSLASYSRTHKDLLSAILPLLDDEIPEVRKKTIIGLSKFGARASSAVPSLQRRFKKGSQSEKVLAVIVLGLIGAESEAAVLPTLIACLLEKDSRSWLAAVRAIGGMGSKATAAVPHLVTCLEDPGYRTVHLPIIVAIGQIGPPAKGAVPVLVKRLKGQEESEIDEAAIALGKIGQEAGQAVPALLGLLTAKQPSSVKCSAASALGYIGKPAISAIAELERTATLAKNDDDLYQACRFSLARLRIAKEKTK